MRLEVKAIIFDMDGVITNTMPDHYKVWKVILQEQGINATYEDIYSREGQRGIDSVREIFAHYHKAVDERTALKILKDKEKYFKQIVKRRFIPGARSFLKGLRKSGFHLALVTGTARHEVHKILPDELYNLFSVIITGSDVHNGKPHPEPFLKALKGLRVKASDAIVIENAPFGIRSARRAGLRCLALATSLPHKYLKQADCIFDSFKELKEKVGFRNIASSPLRRLGQMAVVAGFSPRLVRTLSRSSIQGGKRDPAYNKNRKAGKGAATENGKNTLM